MFFKPDKCLRAGRIFIVMAVPWCAGFAQESQQQLEELRRNISQLQQKIGSFEKSESSELERLRALDEQIDLLSRLAGKLRRQEAAKRAEAQETATGLRQTQGELQRLQSLGAQRAVFFYKYGRMKDLEMLLSARSLNQVVLWAEYQRRLLANDRRVLAGMKVKQERIQAQNDQLASELAAHEKMLAEKLKEEGALKQRRQQREALLKKLQKDKAYHQMQLAEQQAAAERIAKLIAAAEAMLQQQQQQQALEQQQQVKEQPLGRSPVDLTPPMANTYDGPFASRKGRLPKPVNGQIVGHYGSFRHPVLKTITTNLGVDIAAEPGASVRSVAGGKVITITWQRGYGNLMIINHADGYYTVYTRLSEILVGMNETVAAGQVIGRVAEPTAGQQASVHFQIWQRTKEARSQDLNPEEWLQ
ncbi:hypothetical protein EDS67_09505 [candidate division KSB1 bacterium]|nr:MAG: hypothetical protein EDS67_09505 [candidate division KSB1 bacterium]MBC6948396.1 hypothetical protein [candidate division KSB1 bacterium]MCE7943929.1 hypothetical protein [Chlorobi bacterium CHB1]MDL1877714.1 hypothetical protein [Cytophagia bacterium CHB2]NUM73333.1 peptidoglycan DD-metalloendopeptidase family protein [candidate division KSB1 bacterium]